MKPEQFIREQGLDKAREVVEGIPSKARRRFLNMFRKHHNDAKNPAGRGDVKTSKPFAVGHRPPSHAQKKFPLRKS
ncbi:hypothetical protein ACVXEO_002705 [Acinetobacter baumannii]